MSDLTITVEGEPASPDGRTVTGTVMVRLSGGPFDGQEFPTAAGRTSLRIPFRFVDGTVGRCTYEQSALSQTTFTFIRLLTADGVTHEGAALRAVSDAAWAAERAAVEAAAERARQDAEQRVAENARRLDEAERYRVAVEAEPEGIVRTLALLHAPDISEGAWVQIDCPGCDVYGHDAEIPDWPCRTATALLEHLGITTASDG